VSERLGAGLRRIDLLQDPMYLALPNDHVLADAPRVRLHDLADESWVQTSAASPCARHVVRSCHAAGFEPAVSFETDDYQTLQGLVAAGVGVALIPQLALSTVRDDITIRALHPRAPVRTVLAASGRAPETAPAADRMLEVLAEVSRRYGRGKTGR
jgi:DNA-binding transcriptional LysR family regulator